MGFFKQIAKNNNVNSVLSQPVYQQVAVFSTPSLSVSTNQPQTTVKIPQYQNKNLISLILDYSVTETTGATAPTGFTPISSVMDYIKCTSNGGTPLFNLQGNYQSVDKWAFETSNNGTAQNSTIPSIAPSTQQTNSYHAILNFGYSTARFPLTLDTAFAPLSALYTGATALASASASLTITGVYDNLPVNEYEYSEINFPVSSTGLSSNYAITNIPQQRIVFSQSYIYGQQAQASQDDYLSYMNFSTDGSQQIVNKQINAIKGEENNLYFSGHQAGYIRFSNPASGVIPYVNGASSQLNFNVATLPTIGNSASQSIRGMFRLNTLNST
jgi:hypothetical protein